MRSIHGDAFVSFESVEILDVANFTCKQDLEAVIFTDVENDDMLLMRMDQIIEDIFHSTFCLKQLMIGMINDRFMFETVYLNHFLCMFHTHVHTSWKYQKKKKKMLLEE